MLHSNKAQVLGVRPILLPSEFVINWSSFMKTFNQAHTSRPMQATKKASSPFLMHNTERAPMMFFCLDGE